MKAVSARVERIKKEKQLRLLEGNLFFKYILCNEILINESFLTYNIIFNTTIYSTIS